MENNHLMIDSIDDDDDRIFFWKMHLECFFLATLRKETFLIIHYI